MAEIVWSHYHEVISVVGNNFINWLQVVNDACEKYSILEA